MPQLSMELLVAGTQLLPKRKEMCAMPTVLLQHLLSELPIMQHLKKSNQTSSPYPLHQLPIKPLLKKN
jgi:hypothetical protein